MPMMTIRNISDDLHYRFKLMASYEDKTMNELGLMALEKLSKELETKHGFTEGKKNATESKTNK